MRAAVLREVGTPPAVEELTLRPLRPGEIRVKLAASGICHTDLSVYDGGMPAVTPCTLGHEGAGVVEACGADVSGIEVGARVVLTWNVACATCAHCTRGEPYLCPAGLAYAYDAPYASSAPDDIDVWQSLGAGTLAEETIVPAAAAIPIDDALPLDLACLLACGVTTGVGAALRTAGVQPGETVTVIGCGGVGLSAIQGARIAGASRIIAADRAPAQLAAATKCGATDVVDTSTTDLATAVRDLTGGVGTDHALEVVGAPQTILAAYASARRGGIVTLVGAGRYDENVSFPTLSLMADAKQIRGSVYGSTDAVRDIPALATLALEGRLDLAALITERIALSEVNRGFAAMAAGDGARRIVVF
ncbi:MAG TPA: Zn-dependent alcohol dehydrogenase [Mycobacteriales bacterium]|nr:Zn-dependent alcohol dehydrogenase [Mycobacteriales bacterium]